MRTLIEILVVALLVAIDWRQWLADRRLHKKVDRLSATVADLIGINRLRSDGRAFAPTVGHPPIADDATDAVDRG